MQSFRLGLAARSDLATTMQRNLLHITWVAKWKLRKAIISTRMLYPPWFICALDGGKAKPVEFSSKILTLPEDPSASRSILNSWEMNRMFWTERRQKQVCAKCLCCKCFGKCLSRCLKILNNTLLFGLKLSSFNWLLQKNRPYRK